MISKIIAFLNEPYPQEDSDAEILKLSALVSGIVMFILAVFRPFGFDNIDSSAILRYTLIFGVIAFVVMLAYEFFVKYILRIQRDQAGWAFWKWMLSSLMLITCIASANYVYTLYAYELTPSLGHFFLILKNTLSIAVIPILLLGAINITRKSNQNEKIASEIHLSNRKKEPEILMPVRLPMPQSEGFVDIDAHHIICIEAMQNYVQIYHMDGAQLEKTMIRSTISNMELTLLGTAIQRSHRSFLVNTHKIIKVSGNAQGLKLELEPSPGFWVPVSRKYIPDFRKIA